MSNEEAITYANCLKNNYTINFDDMADFCNTVIKALEQEPRKDEVILTKKEYGELVSSEFDNGYAKGYREALEQQSTLDKIRAEIGNHCGLLKENHCKYCSYCNCVMGVREILEVIDKYKAESEVGE